MNQSPPLYDMISALETLEPWLERHLPELEPVARRHFVHSESQLNSAQVPAIVWDRTPSS